MSASIYQPTQGSLLTDANVTKNPASDVVSEYVLPAATLSTNRTMILGVTGSPETKSVVRVVRADLTAHTYTVEDDASNPVYTFAASPGAPVGASFWFDGTHYQFLSAYNVSSPWTRVSVVGSPATQISITGLNGDVDGGYEFDIHLQYAIGPGDVLIKPNGLTTDQESSLMYAAGAPNGAHTTSLRISASGGTGEFRGIVRFSAARSAPRFFYSSAYDSSFSAVITAAGLWTDILTNLTSVVFEAANPGAFAVGSYVAWRVVGPSA